MVKMLNSSYFIFLWSALQTPPPLWSVSYYLWKEQFLSPHSLRFRGLHLDSKNQSIEIILSRCSQFDWLGWGVINFSCIMPNTQLTNFQDGGYELL